MTLVRCRAVGSNFAGIQVRTNRRDVLRCINALMRDDEMELASAEDEPERVFVIVKSGKGWTAVFDGTPESSALASELSSRLDTLAVAYGVFESDALWLGLFGQGDLLTELFAGVLPEGGERVAAEAGSAWEQVLLTTSKPDELSRILNTPRTFVDEALVDAAREFGWDPAAIDVRLESPPTGGSDPQVLCFKRRQPAAWEATRDGPPDFAVQSYTLETVGGPVGSTYSTRSLFGIRSSGGPASSVVVKFSGTAIEGRLLQPVVVRLIPASQVTEGFGETRDLAPQSHEHDAYTFAVKDLPILPGLVMTGPELPLRGPDYNKIEKVLARRQFHFSVELACTKPGTGDLVVEVSPDGEGGARFTYWTEVTAEGS